MQTPVKKILVLTDSVSLPRAYQNGKVQWENIYVNQLRKAFPDVEFILAAYGGATIQQLFIALNYYAVTDPDIIILQSGIVDCAPRALGQLELDIIKKLHLFRMVKPFTSFLRKHRGLAYTSPKDFENYLLKIKAAFPEKPFIAIGILPGSEAYDKQVPGICNRIVQYNAILEAHSIFINNSNFDYKGILEDHHHLNEIGQSILFDKLRQVLQPIISSGNQ
ncbi:MAG: SGNH/GDSL hydrolase family protein [Ferruginibacter sp.]